MVNLLDSGGRTCCCGWIWRPSMWTTRLAAFAAAQGVARISVQIGNGKVEPVAVPVPAETRLAGVAVRPPPAGFLQASAEGEAAIVQAVLDGLPEKLPARARGSRSCMAGAAAR